MSFDHFVLFIVFSQKTGISINTSNESQYFDLTMIDNNLLEHHPLADSQVHDPIQAEELTYNLPRIYLEKIDGVQKQYNGQVAELPTGKFNLVVHN